jgi:hypothetical protein
MVAEAGRPAHGLQHGEQAPDIRRWARTRGIMVSNQGRIPVKVMKLYKVAH